MRGINSFPFRKTRLSQTDTSLLLAELPELDDEADIYLMAKGYFDLREFDRCAFFTKDAKSPRVVFLHYYSRYMSGEKKRLDNATDFIANNDSAQLKYLRDLRQELQKLHEKKVGPCLFLTSVFAHLTLTKFNL